MKAARGTECELGGIVPLSISAMEIPDGWLPHPEYAKANKKKSKVAD